MNQGKFTFWVTFLLPLLILKPGLNQKSLVYGVILARDLCHAQCNLKDPQQLAPFASLLGYGHSPVLFLPRGC